MIVESRARIDPLSTGALEDEELITLLTQLCGGADQLSRLVVLLKRYTAKRGAAHDAALG